MLVDAIANPERAQEHAERLGQPVLVSITRSVPRFDPLALYRESAEVHRTLWLRPSSNEALVGLGAAHVISIDDVPNRFTAASEAWSNLLEHASIDDPAGLLWTGPLLMGGFRFDAERPGTELWRAFATDRLVLPERVFVQSGGAAWLTTNHVFGPRRREPEPVELAPEARGLDRARWQSLVKNVAYGIRQQRLGVDKVVLARTQQVAGAFDSTSVLGALADAYPSCTIFGLGHGDATFVGATPERLVNVCAGLATTMALAGSTARGATEADDVALGLRLLRDPKERAEHAFVVDALRSGLTDVSSRVIADAEPRLRKLANLQHLFTPVHGQLAPGRTILDVVQRLHPTPAVGGWPSAPALELIRTSEGLDRGWYAAPVGWLNRAGEGEFVVGLRSALLRPEEAVLFAGCGIVADSDPLAELAESDWKLRPMLSALGQKA